MKKGQNIKSTEDINFPKGLQFFRNTFASMAITMLIVFSIVYIPEGIMYNTGIKLLPLDPTAAAAINGIFGPGQINWLVRCVLDAFTFAAGVEIILYGVRMAIGELVPAFKGISDKLVKNSKAAIDCPIIFPYAPNAVLIGFLSSMIAGIVGIGLTVGLNAANATLPIIIPGIIAHFFLGATSGVFGNSKGGVWGAVIGSFIHGIIITMVPIIFIAGKWSVSSGLGWGDTDYLIGVIPGLIGLIGNRDVMKTLMVLIPSAIFIALVADGLLDKFIFKPKKDKLIKVSESNDIENIEENVMVEEQN